MVRLVLATEGSNTKYTMVEKKERKRFQNYVVVKIYGAVIYHTWRARNRRFSGTYM